MWFPQARRAAILIALGEAQGQPSRAESRDLRKLEKDTYLPGSLVFTRKVAQNNQPRPATVGGQEDVFASPKGFKMNSPG